MTIASQATAITIKLMMTPVFIVFGKQLQSHNYLTQRIEVAETLSLKRMGALT